MKENEIKIHSKGIRMKTLPENIDKWTERILNVFKENGYEFICSEEIEDCVQLTLERDVDAIILTIHQNGEMQFNTTENINELLNVMVPQIEENLGITFKQNDDYKEILKMKSSREEIIKSIENEEETLDTLLIHNTSKISNVINNLEQHFSQKKCSLTNDYLEKGTADQKIKNSDLEKMGIMQKKRLLLFLTAQHDELIYMKRRLNKSQDELTMLRTDMMTLKDQFNRFKMELSKAAWKTDEKVDTVLRGLQATKEKFYQSIRNEISIQMKKVDTIEIE